MTQALINNLNNISIAALSSRNNFAQFSSVSSQADYVNNTGFQKIFNAKTPENTDIDKSFSLEDIKKLSVKQPGQSGKYDNSDEVIRDAAGEISGEISLDLTLKKDIHEIISQFNNSIKNIPDKSGESGSGNSEENKNDTEISGTESNINNSLIFGHVLACIDKAGAITNTEILQDIVSDAEAGSNDAVKVLQDLQTNEEKILPNKTDINELENILDEDSLKELNIEKICAGTNTDTSDESSLMQKQTAQEYSVKVILNQSGEAFETKAQEVDGSIQNPENSFEITPNKIIEQITKQFEGFYNNSRVNISLNPESLGKVNIQLINTKEGLSAEFTVTTQEAKELLMKGLDGLKDSLLSHGVSVDNVSVKLNDTQRSEYNQNWTEHDGSRGGNKEQNHPDKQEKEKGLFEKTIAQANEKEKNGNV